MRKPTPQLSPQLVSRAGTFTTKGQAAPAALPELAPAPQGVTSAAPTPRPTLAPVQGTIAVTVRLDPVRYDQLKAYGARNRMTNQAIIVAALDRYLESSD